jgi:hypothetical protein
MYYIIEKYNDDVSRAPGCGATSYDVRGYDTLEGLERGILAGSRHGGQLIPVKGLEMRLAFDDEQPVARRFTSSLAEQINAPYRGPYE